MPADMFLKLDNVKGESQDKDHKDEIEVLSWSWGFTQEADWHHGTGGGAPGKVAVHDLNFTHKVDRASIDLMTVCVKGDHIAKGKLVCRKPGGQNPLEYLTIDLEKILVRSIQSGGADGSDSTENVALHFDKFKIQYNQQSEKGGKQASPTLAMDIAAYQIGG